MGNKVSSRRTLTPQEVIDLVKSINTPVLRIEKELGISPSVLQRALKPDTQKPLPVKFEKPLMDFVSRQLNQSKIIENKREAVLEKTGKDEYKREVSASVDEMDSKRQWLNDVRAAVKATYADRVLQLFSK